MEPYFQSHEGTDKQTHNALVHGYDHDMTCPAAVILKCSQCLNNEMHIYSFSSHYIGETNTKAFLITNKYINISNVYILNNSILSTVRIHHTNICSTTGTELFRLG